MNFAAFRRNIALFLVAVIVLVLACRIVVALIEVILLAICLGVIIFFGFAEDIITAWKLLGQGMQEACTQWQDLLQKKFTKKPDAENQGAENQDVDGQGAAHEDVQCQDTKHHDVEAKEDTQKAEKKEV